MDTSHCPSRQQIEKAFSADASLEEKARLADHALACPNCRVRLNVAAGLAVETRRRAAGGRTGAHKDQTAPGRRPFRRRFFDRAFAPASALLMAGLTLLAALWIMAPPGDGLSFRGAGPAVLELIAPSGVLSEPPRVFCWSPYPGADTYGFELVDDRLEPIIPNTGLSLLSTALIVPDALRESFRPGRVYVWRVWALDENSIPVATEQKSFEIRPRN